MNLNQIHDLIGGEVINEDNNIQFNGVKPLDVATKHDVVFLFSKIPSTIQTNARLIIANKKLDFNGIQIIHPEPRLAMATLLQVLYQHSLNDRKYSISKHASIDESATLNQKVEIDAFVKINANTKVGKNTVIHAGAFIGKNCQIGDNCVIYSNASIYDNVTIGNNAIIHSSAVIGSDGFGFEKNKNHWQKLPHVGKVIIGDDVEIGSNTSIDRACLTETVIGSGVKIDNLVQIGHNCIIDEHTVIAAGSLIGGSAVGKNCIIAGDVSVKDNVSIGDNSIVLAKSGVTKDVPSGSQISGFPAISHKEKVKRDARINRLLKSTIEN